MTFQFENSLCTYDKQGQPYSIEVEKDNAQYHLNGRGSSAGYALTFNGARAYINIPTIRTFSLKFDLLYYKNHCVGLDETFGIVFGYDRFARTGYQLEIIHVGNGSTKIRLLSLSGRHREVLKEQAYDFLQECNIQHPVHLTVTEDSVHCTLDNLRFDCATTAVQGKIGFLREAAFREHYISHLQLETEEITQTPVGEYTMVLPRDNGAELAYSLTVCLFDLGENITRVDYTLGDGLWSRKPMLKSEGNCWALIYNEFTGLYFACNNQKRLYIENGTARIIDANYLPRIDEGTGGELPIIQSISDIYRSVTNVWAIPVSGTFLVQDLGNLEEITVGYDKFLGFGAEFYSGERQFVFDTKGKLLYNGEPLDSEFSIDVKSPLNQALADAIPSNACDREMILHHLEGNHYFYTDTENEFTVDIRSTHGTEDLSVRCYLQDAFLRTEQELPVIPVGTPNQYSKAPAKSYGIHLQALPLGVYHLSVEIFYFGEFVKEHHSAFEVIDPSSDLSPQEASGLFRAHVGDGAPLGMTLFFPDPWSPMADFNIGHYISNALVLPYAADRRRVWEVYPLFKRKTFSWMNSRAVASDDLISGKAWNFGVTKNFDFIFNGWPSLSNGTPCDRPDFFIYSKFKSRFLENLEEFLYLHPDIQSELRLDDVKKSFSVSDYNAFMSRCCGQFIDFCLPLIAEAKDRDWEKITAVNSHVKRHSYGLWAAYLGPNVGAYSARWYGTDATKSYELADGYTQFEDYPHDCGYSTTRGAWGIATSKFLDPRAVIYPEVYDAFKEGCPDAAISPAHPPLGYFRCAPHLCTTQVYEYIFNTPYCFADQAAYSYWRDYGLMFYSLYVNDPDAKMDEFMHAWGIAMDNKPVKPQKGSVFLYEITSEDDRFDPENLFDVYSQQEGYNYSGHAFHNISDAGLTFVNMRLREAGLPSSGLIGYSGLAHLTKDNCDILVLPSLRQAPPEAIAAIRKLHAEGVALAAVYDITGLEDLFGVRQNFRKKKLSYFTDGQTVESIAPLEAELFYDAAGSKVLLQADDGEPILIRNGNAILLNAPVCQAGVDSVRHAVSGTANNISILLEDILSETLRELSSSEFVAERRCGITPFVNEKGEDILLLIDYSKDLDTATYDSPRYATITLPEGYQNVECLYGAKKIGKRYQNGYLSALSVPMLRQQSVLLKLAK